LSRAKSLIISAAAAIDQAVSPGALRTAFSSMCISPGPDSYGVAAASTKCVPISGRVLAREQPVDADVIVPVPTSGVSRPPSAMRRPPVVPMRMGLIRKPLTWAHLHSAAGVDPPFRRESETESGAECIATGAGCPGGRLPQCGTTSQRSCAWCAPRGAKEVHVRNQLPADDFAVLLRRRHAEQVGTDRRHATLEEIREVFSKPTPVAYLSLEGLPVPWDAAQLLLPLRVTRARIQLSFPPATNATYLSFALKLDKTKEKEPVARSELDRPASRTRPSSCVSCAVLGVASSRLFGRSACGPPGCLGRAASGGDRHVGKARLRGSHEGVADCPPNTGGAGSPALLQAVGEHADGYVPISSAGASQPDSTIRAPRTLCAESLTSPRNDSSARRSRTVF